MIVVDKEPLITVKPLLPIHPWDLVLRRASALANRQEKPIIFPYDS